jgi:hypothetical protein
LAVGCKDGTIYFCSIDIKKIIKGREDIIEPILDISWNPGEDILAVVYASGKMRLYAQDNTTPSIKFES